MQKKRCGTFWYWSNQLYSTWAGYDLAFFNNWSSHDKRFKPCIALKIKGGGWKMRLPKNERQLHSKSLIGVKRIQYFHWHIYMSATNVKMDPSSANFYDIVRENPQIPFWTVARSNWTRWEKNLDSCTNQNVFWHDGDSARF